MKLRSLLLLSVCIFGALHCTQAEPSVHRVSICSLQENPGQFLNAKIEVRAFIYAGVEYPRLWEGKCSFRFARGND
jgi:hypothetical protein